MGGIGQHRINFTTVAVFRERAVLFAKGTLGWVIYDHIMIHRGSADAILFHTLLSLPTNSKQQLKSRMSDLI